MPHKCLFTHDPAGFLPELILQRDDKLCQIQYKHRKAFSIHSILTRIYSIEAKPDKLLLSNGVTVKYKAPHDKTNKIACAPREDSDRAPREDSDQPGHLPSLIRVYAVCMKKAWVLSYPLRAQ